MADIDRKDFKQAIIQWEIGRVIYNLVLLIVGLGLSYHMIDKFGLELYLLEVFLFAIAANLCYCAGPLLEVYLLAFGIKLGTYRYAFFIFGLCFSIAITLIGALAQEVHVP